MENNNLTLITSDRRNGNYYLYSKYPEQKILVRDRKHILEIIYKLVEKNYIDGGNLVNLINDIMREPIPNLPSSHQSGSNRITDEIIVLQEFFYLLSVNQAQINLNNMKDLPRCVLEEDKFGALCCNIYYNARDEEGENTSEKRCSGLLYSQQEAKQWIDKNSEEEKIEIMEVLKLKKQIEESSLKEFDEFYVVDLPERIEELSLVSKN